MLIASTSDVVLPRKFLEAPSCWLGRDLQCSTSWEYRFSDSDHDELGAALADVKKQGMALVQITRGDFPLPRLGKTLAAIRREVLEGRGFVLLRGLRVDQLGRDSAVVYWGLGMHLGFPVSQNARGHLLGHVIDLGEKSMNEKQPAGRAEKEEEPFIHTKLRGYNSSARLYFHVDYCDIVGLLCLRSARVGGLSQIVSSVAIHNEIMKHRPDLLRVLYEPFWATRYNEIPVGAKPYYQTAIFHYVHGRLITKYVPQVIRVGQSFTEVPRLSALQWEALELVETLANTPDFQLNMDLQPGDIQFINNHVVLHSRTAFEDSADIEEKRHLLRLWLVTPDGQHLPESFYEHYRGGRRGGIYVPGMTEAASFDP